MVYRILKNGLVVNTIVASVTFVTAYCEKNGYEYEEIPSMPEPVETEPTPQDDTDAMLVDHEYRITLLELGLTE